MAKIISMSHDSHHNEGKKAVFGPPVIMGLSFWLFAFFFLSLCNGKKEHGTHEAAAEGHGAKTEQVEPVKETPKVEAVATEELAKTDSVATEEKK